MSDDFRNHVFHGAPGKGETCLGCGRPKFLHSWFTDGETLRFDPTPGMAIDTAAKQMVTMVAATGVAVVASFNEIALRADVGSTDYEAIVSRYQAESERRSREYIASPEYKRHCEEAEQRDRDSKADFAAAIASAPAAMSIALGKEDAYLSYVQQNSGDGYSLGVVNYGEAWARLMESKLAAGATVEECAEETSRLADTDGITGFMYGCAVQALAQFWAHGEALRRWHNLRTQIGNEGERANRSGGVLNPALLSIG